ncbi:hypothetical protein ACF1DY_01785 [Streptomyces albus]
MKIRRDVADLLRQGLSDRRISEQLHVDAKAVAATRKALGLPKHRPGRAPAASLEEAFWARTEPVEGGHLRWTGTRGRHEAPIVCFRGRRVSAYRVAFGLSHTREPRGHCSPGCGYPGCVAPEHVDDDLDRTRTRAMLHAVQGRQVQGDVCKRGHEAAEHRRYTSTGRAYCGACSRLTSGGGS